MTPAPKPDSPTIPGPARKAALRRRNLATLAAILAFAALIYAVGIIRMKGL